MSKDKPKLNYDSDADTNMAVGNLELSLKKRCYGHTHTKVDMVLFDDAHSAVGLVTVDVAELEQALLVLYRAKAEAPPISKSETVEGDEG
jgi:hypothetical protein